MKKRLLLFLSISYFLTFNAHPDLINSCTIINKNKVVVKANEKFSQRFILQDFFVQYDNGVDLTKLDTTIVQIPFIMNIIPVVWVSNETYAIDAIDKNLYHSLQEIKKVFKLFYPEQQWAGELVPKKLVTNTITPVKNPDKPSLGVLFSGGLDSVHTSMSCIDTKQLLITHWGIDVRLHKKKMWSCVQRRCQQFAQKYGHEQTFARSNSKYFIGEKKGEPREYLANKLHKIVHWWGFTTQTLSYVGVAVPILATHNIPMVFMSSSHVPEDPSPYGTHPAIDNNINAAGITVYHYGVDENRVQKIIDVSSICKKEDLPLPYLRVCWGKDLRGGNCLKCGDKCLCTAINVAVAGHAPQEYGFNISVSEAIKKASLYLKNEKYLRKSFMMFAWECNLPYLDSLSKRARMNRTLFNQDVDALRSFFDSTDFGSFIAPAGLLFNNVSYSQERQKLFNDLWKKHSKPCPIKRE